MANQHETRTPARERILLFIPAYNCAPQLPRVLAQLTHEVRALLSEVIIVDNRSSDNGVEAAKAALSEPWSLPVKILQNDENYGLGGSHKVAFNYALDHGFDYCIVLHGDDQGAIADLVAPIRAGAHRRVDCLLGARFMAGSKLAGYSPIRTLGNRAFNLLYSAVSGKWIYDLGAGLNLYAVSALASRSYLRHPNDLTFNYHMILTSIAENWRIQFIPIEWREDDQVSNVKLVRQAIRVLRAALDYGFGRKAYLAADHSGAPAKRYSAKVIFETKAMAGEAAP
ncbi:MAG: glycosyltransferase family 2 protein [Hyphomonadaceae bacterium]